MARTTSKTTVEKIGFVRELLKKNTSLTQRDVRARVHKKYGTGLSYKHIACIVRGEDPLKSANGAGKGKISKKNGRRPRTNGRDLTESPQFFVSVPAASVLSGFERKTEVRDEIARLIATGVSPDEITVYGQEDFGVTTRHVVSF